MSFHINFGEDPCTRTGAIGVNANFISCACYYANFISCARVYASCACVRTRILTKIFVGVHYKHKNLILKFHKDPSFRCGDICKTVLTFKSHQFSMYFPCFHRHPSKVFKDGELLNSYGIFWKLVIKMFICNGQKDTCPSL